jgi:hypothetical protein
MDLSAAKVPGGVVMSREKNDRITVIEEPLPEGEVDCAVRGILGAYNSIGFEQGYARATRYLVAMLPMLVEQFDREYVGIEQRDREILRLFGKFLEEKLAQTAPVPVDD